jgi:hypothetical protein
MKSFKEYLKESPYVTDEGPSVLQNTFPSISSDRIKRDLKLLFNVNGVDVYEDINNRSELRLIGVEDKKSDIWSGEHRYKVVIRLQATKIISSYMLRGGNNIQIKNVEIVDTKQGEGTLSAVYINLVKLGYTVVSDKIQLVGGMNLWKSLIKKDLSAFNIQVWNVKKNSYIGAPGVDVPLDIIWTSNDNTSGKNLLLVISKKGI